MDVRVSAIFADPKCRYDWLFLCLLNKEKQKMGRAFYDLQLLNSEMNQVGNKSCALFDN